MVNPLKIFSLFSLFFLLLIILFYSIIIYGQNYEPKQITDFDFDSRNPVFLQYPLNLQSFSQDSELFFEAVTDSLISICSIKYNAVSDSFYQLTYISSNSNPNSNIINRNANGKYIQVFFGLNYKMLLWETNQNGSWNIAFSIDSGNGWTPQSFLFSSPEDELDASFVIDHEIYSPNDLYEILYTQSNSVYIFSKSETEKTELIFEGSDTVNFSSSTGAYRFFPHRLYVVAVEEKIGQDSRLVYRFRNLGDTLWSDKQDVIEITPAFDPKFTNPDGGILLSFEIDLNGLKKNLLIRPEEFGQTSATISLVEDSTIETSDFSAFTYYVITENSLDDYYTYNPFAFRYRKNDSTFIRTGIFDWYIDPYSDYYTKDINSKPAIGPLGLVFTGEVSYTIWEDSSNNRINLFGVKRVDYLGTVENSSMTANSFRLSQNYPNPFNPTTTIRFTISDLRFTILKVYDVLGNKIATLVNEEKPPGSYEVEFDGANLTSGIYFYQLQVVDPESSSGQGFVETRKMILMK